MVSYRFCSQYASKCYSSAIFRRNCGEKYYTDEVAERLEVIVDTAKKMMQEIAVIDYPQVA